MPIRPSKIVKAKKLHPLVEKVVDEMLVEKWDGRRAVLLQKDIMQKLTKLMKLKPEQHQTHIFDKNLLDFEPFYEAVGWKVVYDKPAYYETYDASFTFTEK